MIDTTNRFSKPVFIAFMIMLFGILSLSPVFSAITRNVVIGNTGRILIPTELPSTYRSEIRGVFLHSGTFSFDHDWNVIAQTLANYKITDIYVEFGQPFSTYHPSNVVPQWGDRDEVQEALTVFHPLGIRVHYVMDVLTEVQVSRDFEFKSMDYNLVPTDWASPTRTHDRIISVVEDVARNYDIDGFMFDYTRYEYSINDNGQGIGGDGITYDPEARAQFSQWLTDNGLPPITNWPGPFAPGGARNGEFMEWRTQPITDLVRDIRSAMLAIKPDLVFSIASWTLFGNAPTYWRYWLGQDTAYWVAQDYLDHVAPMMYTSTLTGPESIEDFVTNTYEYIVGSAEGKKQFTPFITTGIESRETVTAFVGVVNKVRSMGADGWIIWRYGGPGIDSGGELFDIRPYLNAISLPDTFALGNIEVTGSTISWTTSLPATSKVEYSTSPLFNASKKYSSEVDFHYWDVDYVGGLIRQDSTAVTAHSVTLTGLMPNTKYYFRVQSVGPGGTATSAVLTFNTT